MSNDVLVAEIAPADSLSIEAQMTVTGQRIVNDAKAMRIANSEDYESAGATLRKIKEQVNKVKDYWSEPKKTAQAAHKQIVEKEKAMLKYFTDAEAIIKSSMKAYIDAVEKAQREAEAEAMRRQQEEALRLLDKAASAEEAGNDQEAMINMAMAEMVSDMAATCMGVDAPKAQGISTRRVWKARVVDATKVPAYAMGMELRTVSMSALNNIARMSKGSAQIPGVEFYEESSISARS